MGCKVLKWVTWLWPRLFQGRLFIGKVGLAMISQCTKELGRKTAPQEGCLLPAAKTAPSPGGSLCGRWRKAPFSRGIPAPSSTWFPKLARLHIPNATSIGSADNDKQPGSIRIMMLKWLFGFPTVGLSSRVVSASDCGVRGSRFESRRWQLCLSRQQLRYTVLSTGCAPLLQCLGRLSLPPFVGR